MKKIFKKSLALMVSAALCLTAFVGCLTVNAETPSNTATLTVGSKEITQGTTTVTVPVTLQANDSTEIAAARFSLVIDSSVFTFTDVIDNCVVVPEGAKYDVSVSTTDGSYPSPKSGNTYIFIVEATKDGSGEDIATVASATFDLVLTVATNAAADTYAFAGYEGEDPKVAILEACDLGTATNVNEQLVYGPENEVVITPTFGSVTIKAAHTHDYATLQNDGTNHWYVCSCGETNGLEAHTYGEWVVDEEASTTKEGSKHRDCSVCNYREIATIPVIEHTHSWEFVSATPAVNGGDAGQINFKCSNCDETKIVNDVQYLAQSTLANSNIGCNSTTQLILQATVKGYSTSTAGYVVVTHQYTDGSPDETFVLSIKEASSSTNYYSWIVPVKTKNFSDTFTTVFYTERDGVWYSGIARPTSIRDAAMSTIKSSTIDPSVKRVAADLLTMGAQAQIRFNYCTDNLADSQLVGDYAQYVTTTTPSIQRTSENFNRNTEGLVSGEKLGISNPSISLGDSISINIIALGSLYKDVASINDLKMKVTYTSYNGVLVTDTISEYTTDRDTNGNPTKFNFAYNVTAPNMRSILSIQFFNGDTAVGNVNTFSVEGILATAVSSDPSYTSLVNAIMNYSDTAVESFQ